MIDTICLVNVRGKQDCTINPGSKNCYIKHKTMFMCLGHCFENVDNNLAGVSKMIITANFLSTDNNKNPCFTLVTIATFKDFTTFSGNYNIATFN